MATAGRPYRLVAALLVSLLLGLHGAPLLHHWCMGMEQEAGGIEHMAMATEMDAESEAMPPCHGDKVPDTAPASDAIMVCCTTALVGLHATPTPRPHADVQVLVPTLTLTLVTPTAAPRSSTPPLPVDTGPPPAVPLHILHAAFLI